MDPVDFSRVVALPRTHLAKVREWATKELLHTANPQEMEILLQPAGQAYGVVFFPGGRANFFWVALLGNQDVCCLLCLPYVPVAEARKFPSRWSKTSLLGPTGEVPVGWVYPHGPFWQLSQVRGAFTQPLPPRTDVVASKRALRVAVWGGNLKDCKARKTSSLRGCEGVYIYIYIYFPHPAKQRFGLGQSCDHTVKYLNSS